MSSEHGHLSVNIAALLERMERLEVTLGAIADRLPGEPVRYLSFPKWLCHPQADGTRLADVMVNTYEQEQEYRAKGYSGKIQEGQEEDYFVTKVAERLAKLIRQFHFEHHELLEKVRHLDERIDMFYAYLGKETEEDPNAPRVY